MEKEYKFLSKYYDALHQKKDYGAESLFFTKLINKHKKSEGTDLLDVACGTGSHLFYLKKNFFVMGIDLNKDVLEIAEKKNPGINFEVEDMLKLKTNKKYDAITLLFSSIAYLRNKEEIIKALGNFQNSLKAGGVLLIETSFLKNSLKNGEYTRSYSGRSLSIARVMNFFIDKNVVEVKAKYIIKEKGEPVKEVKDKIKVPLFTKEVLVKIIKDVGFAVSVSSYKKSGTTIFACTKTIPPQKASLKNI